MALKSDQLGSRRRDNMVKRKYNVPTKKYKVSAYVRGKLRVATIEAKNKPEAQRKAAKKWGKAVDVGHYAIVRM